MLFSEEDNIEIIKNLEYGSSVKNIEMLVEYINSGVALASVDVNKSVKLIYTNSVLKNMSKRHMEYTDDLAETLFGELSEDDNNLIRADCVKIAEDGIVRESIVKVKDSEQWRLIRASRLCVNEDNTAVVIATITDVSEMKKYEQQLGFMQNKYKIASDLSNSMLWEVDVENHEIFLATPNASGIAPAKSSYKNVPDNHEYMAIFHPNSWDTVRQVFVDIYNGNDKNQYFAQLKNDSGGYAWAKFEFKLVVNEFGKNYAVGVCRIQANMELRMQIYQQAVRLTDILTPYIRGIFIANLSKGVVEKCTILPKELVEENISSEVYLEIFQRMVGFPESKELIEYLSNINKWIKDFNDGHEYQIFNCRSIDKDGKISWVKIIINLIENPITGDIMLHGYAKKSEYIFSLEKRLSIPISTEYFGIYYSRNTFENLFKIAVDEIRENEFCSVAVLEIKGLEHLTSFHRTSVEKLFTFTQICTCVSSGEVVPTIWDDTHVVFFRAGIKNLSEYRKTLEKQYAETKNIINLLPGFEELEFIVGYDIENKYWANFYTMVDKAIIACELGLRWTNPIVSYRDTEINISDADSFGLRKSLDTSDIIEQNKKYREIIRQQSYQIRLAEHDSFTGLLSRTAFYRNIKENLLLYPEKNFCLYRLDIDNFKFINERLGTESGDRLLKFTSLTIKKFFNDIPVASRLEADHFVILIQNYNSGDEIEFFDSFTRIMEEYEESKVALHMGVYSIDDYDLEPNSMCDRALLALKSVKKSYTERIGYYKESMHLKMIRVQELAAEMQEALDNNEFDVYFQPQVNYENGELIGAEALVRWNHSTRGMIPPGVFIPLFEENGSISKLDYYVWEKCCQYLRKWKDNPTKYPNIPVSLSVNVSRVDIYNPDLCNDLIQLIQKYKLLPSELKLEITESAYMQNPEQLIRTVETLHKSGFIIEMDDFGAGYSSLNTLKDVCVDILKLDIKFLSQGVNDVRGGNILSSVIRMAHWLKIPVVAEGVETKSQADYLKSLGCYYMQGYYFYRPMPLDDFEDIIINLQVGKADRYDEVELDGMAEFWDPSAQTTLIFNSFVGGAAIMEYSPNGRIEVIRANDKFYNELNTDNKTFLELQNQADLGIDESCINVYLNMVNSSLKTGEESECELLTKFYDENSDQIWIDLKVRALCVNNESYLLYVVIQNITKRKKAEDELKVSKEVLQLAMAQMGHIVGSYDVESNTITVPESYAVKRNLPTCYFVDINSLSDVVPENREKCLHMFEEIKQGVKSGCVRYRTVYADGNYSWEQASFVTIFNSYGKPRSAVITFDDITVQIEQVISNARTTLMVDNNNLVTMDFDVANDVVHIKSNVINKGVVSFATHKYLKENFINAKAVHPDYMVYVRNKLLEIINSKPSSGAFEYLASYWGTDYHWCKIHYVSLGDENDNVYWVAGQISPDKHNSTESDFVYDGSVRGDQLLSLINETPTGIYVIDKESYELQYMNNVMTKVHGNDYFGKRCYEYIRSFIEPCKNCDIKSVKPFEFTVREFCDIKANKTYELKSKIIKWNEKDAHVQYIKDISDVSDAKRALTKVLDNVVVGMAVYKITNKIETLDFSDGLAQMLNCTREEYLAGVSNNLLDTIYQGDVKALEDLVFSKSKLNEDFQATFRIATKNIVQMWVSLSAEYIEDSYDGYPMYNAIFTPIDLDSIFAKEVMDKLDIGISIIDKFSNELYYANKQLLEFYKVDTNKSYAGKACYEVFFDANEPCSFCCNHNLAARGLVSERYVSKVDKTFRISVSETLWMGRKSYIEYFWDISEKVKVSKALEIERQTYQLVANQSLRSYLRLNLKSFEIDYLDKELMDVIGAESISDFTKYDWDSCILPESKLCNKKFYNDMISGISNGEADINIMMPDGTTKCLNCRYNLIFDEDNNPCYSIISYLDVTTEYEKELEIQRVRTMVKAHIDESEILYEIDLTDGKLIKATDSHGDNVDIGFDDKSMDFVMEKLAERQVAKVSIKSFLDFTKRERLLSIFNEGIHEDSFTYMALEDGKKQWHKLKVFLSEQLNNGHIISFFSRTNVDKEYKEKLALNNAILLDPMTKLLNKTHTEKAIAESIVSLKENEKAVLFMIDVDNFKMVNDNLGHIVGDKLIKDVSSKLCDMFRQEDIIGRIGGDEFMVFVKGYLDKNFINRKAEEILLSLKCKYEDLVVSASIGAVACDNANIKFTTLYKRVDKALYTAKNKGKNTYFIDE